MKKILLLVLFCASWTALAAAGAVPATSGDCTAGGKLAKVIEVTRSYHNDPRMDDFRAKLLDAPCSWEETFLGLIATARVHWEHEECDRFLGILGETALPVLQKAWARGHYSVAAWNFRNCGEAGLRALSALAREAGRAGCEGEEKYSDASKLAARQVETVAGALANFGSGGRTELEALLFEIGPCWRGVIAQTLLEFGVSELPLIVRAINESSGVGRENLVFIAARDSQTLGKERSILLPPILSSLEVDQPPMVRGRAALALGYFSYFGAEVAPVLAALLQDQDYSVANVAAEAMQQLGKEAAPAIPQLIAAMGEGRRNGRAAATVMAAIGEEAIPALVEALFDGDEFRRYCAADALAQMGEVAAPAVPFLLKARGLASNSGHVRGKIDEALGEIGPAARDAAPALARQIRSPNVETRTAALRAVISIAPVTKRESAEVIRSLSNPDSQVRLLAAARLGSLAADGSPAVAPLLIAAGDADPDVRFAAIVSLGRLGTVAIAAAPELERISEDPCETETNRMVALMAAASVQMKRER